VQKLKVTILIYASLCACLSNLAFAESQSEPETPPPATPAAQTPGLSVDEILHRDPQRSDYVEDVRCISVRKIRSVEVIDDTHVAFHLQRNKHYLVQFKRRCPGLRRGQPIMYAPRSNNLCVLDSIRTVYERASNNFQPGVSCAIPNFQSVTKEQLVLLKDALKAEKRKAKKT